MNTHKEHGVVTPLCCTFTPQKWEKNPTAKYQSMWQKAFFSACSSVIWLSIKLHTLLHSMVFSSFWGKSSEILNLPGDWEIVRVLRCRFFGWKPFCKRQSRDFWTFQKSLLLSCSLSCCSHWSCAHWVSRYVLHGQTFYHILLITFLDLPFRTPRSQLCMALNPFHLLCFLRAVFNPDVLILQRSHSQSLCVLTRNTWRKWILVLIFLFSLFFFFF